MNLEKTSGRKRFWAVIGSLSVIALLFTLLVRREHSEEPTARARIESVRTPVLAADPAPNTKPAPTHAPTDVAAAPAVDDLCGVSDAEKVRLAGESLDRHVGRVTEKAMESWQAALLESKEMRHRAVAVALEQLETLSADAANASDTPATNKLVLLAIETSDPAIYSLALGRCLQSPMYMAAGSCQGLSLDEYARIDPDNAQPWLWIASRADSKGDAAAMEDALKRAAESSRLDTYAAPLNAAALDALPPAFTPLEKAKAGTDLIAITPLSVPFGPMVGRLCSESAVQAPARKEQCASIAKLLAEQGATIMEAGMAAELGKRVGWPKADVAALQAEISADAQAVAQSSPWTGDENSVQGFGCQKVQRYAHYVDQLAAQRGDERAAWMAARSGKH